MESPGGYVTDVSFKRSLLIGTVFLRTTLPCSGGYHLERDGMPLHDAVRVNCRKGELQKIKVQVSNIIVVRVLSDLTCVPLLGGGSESWHYYV